MTKVAKIIGKVRATIERNSLICEGEKVLAAVSGGADSIVMAHILNELAGEMNLRLEIASVNHRQRLSAGKEIELVAEFAKKLNLPFHPLEIALKKNREQLSEDELREARYELLFTLAEKIAAQKLATAHHKNDLAESLVMRLIRGSGPAGLSGIPYRRGEIIRPVLDLTRAEIEEYAQESGLQFVTDETNLSDKYFRSRVRNAIMPEIYRENPSFAEVAARLSLIYSEDEKYFEKIVMEAIENYARRPEVRWLGEIAFPRAGLLQYPNAIKRRILRALLENEGLPPDFKAVDIALKAIESGKSETLISLGSERWLYIFRESFYIYNQEPYVPRLERMEISSIGDYSLRDVQVNISRAVTSCNLLSRACRLDNRKVKFPFFVRGAEPGDKIPDKATTKRNYSIYRRLQKLACPKLLRPAFPVIADENDKIIAVPLIYSGVKRDIPPENQLIVSIHTPALDWTLKHLGG
ncbi:MAG: tRNA lysidine(34) synthetase TilS [Myxococcota bacterium]